jgi:hypothetical protein
VPPDSRAPLDRVAGVGDALVVDGKNPDGGQQRSISIKVNPTAETFAALARRQAGS